MAESLKKNLLWAEAAADSSIASFQHPLFDTAFSKDTFGEMFMAVLEQLDGTSEADYVDFFFKRSPVEPSMLVFVGDDEQQDFLDWAQEEGCIDEASERTGESAEEKAARLAEAAAKKEADAAKAEADEASRAKQRAAADAQRAAVDADPALKAAKDICNRVTGRDKAKAKAAKVSAAKQAKELAKVAKAQSALEALVAKFVEEFPDRRSLLPEEFGGEGEAVAKRGKAKAIMTVSAADMEEDEAEAADAAPATTGAGDTSDGAAAAAAAASEA